MPGGSVSLSPLFFISHLRLHSLEQCCIQKWERLKNVTLYNRGLSLGDLGLGTQSVRGPELGVETTVIHPTNTSLT